jgi:hypothetical protein
MCGQLVTAPAPILLVTCSCGARVQLRGHSDGSSTAQPVDLYEVLGVDRSASADDVRSAYRQRARETHPDAGGDVGAFQTVQAAWEVLGDPERRRAYDRTGARPLGSGGVAVPDLLGVSALTAVRRVATSGLTPRIGLSPVSDTDPLRDLVIGQDPAPGTAAVAGQAVTIVVAGSDAGVLWRGLRRDADRVADAVRDQAAHAAAVAVDTGRRALITALRLAALLFVIAAAVVIGVYDAVSGLIVLAVGGSLVAWSAMQSTRRRANVGSGRRRVRHR